MSFLTCPDDTANLIVFLFYAVLPRPLLGRVLQVGDQVSALVGLLQTSEHHLGAGDVLLGVLQVLEEGLLVPGDALGLVGVRVGEARSLASLATEQTAQVGSGLVLAASLHGVALRATLHKDLLALLNVSGGNSHVGMCVLGSANIIQMTRQGLTHV